MNDRSLHPDVLAELAARFTGEDLADAQALLEGSPLPLVRDPASVDGARIHLAAIKRAGGSLTKLKSALALASSDWRDLLLAAGLANADWREVLAREGFRVPR